MSNKPALIIISAVDLRAEIQQVISQHVGVVASVINIKPILHMILEHVFYGDIMCTKQAIMDQITNYNIPTDPATKLLAGLFVSVNTAIANVRNKLPLNTSFDFELDKGSNIIVTVYDAHTKPLIEPTYPTEDEIVSEMEMEFAGAYYPERMRRAAGL